MKMGFTGTRLGLTDAQVCILEGLLGKVTEFHHGSCIGADILAAKMIRELYGMTVKIIAHPGPKGDETNAASGVDDYTMPPKTHFLRNRHIVDSVDAVIACPGHTNSKFGGVWYTINYAKKKGVKVTIITPEGNIQ